MLTNDCRFIGRLVSDPETRKTQSDVTVANFTLAVESRRFKDQAGKWQSQTEFLDFEIWDSGAENFTKRFKQGDKIAVRASARVNKWEDKESGKERRTIRFRVDEFESIVLKPRDRTEDTEDAQNLATADIAGNSSDIPF